MRRLEKSINKVFRSTIVGCVARTPALLLLGLGQGLELGLEQGLELGSWARVPWSGLEQFTDECENEREIRNDAEVDISSSLKLVGLHS